MTSKNVKAFYEKVESDEVLQGKLKEMKVTSEEEQVTKFLHIAKEEGFEFSEEDLQSYVQELMAKAQENGELDEDMLDQVSGGATKHWFMFSIGTLGVLCIQSAVRKKTEKGCDLDYYK